MVKTLLEKMYLEPTYKSAILHIPASLKTAFPDKETIDTALSGSYDFILVFYIKKSELEKELEKVKTSLSKNSLLWIVYPKGKALETDLNRDIMRELLQKQSLESVSLVSLDDTWSAMRFKN